MKYDIIDTRTNRNKIRDFLIAHYANKGDCRYNQVMSALHTLHKEGLLDEDTWEYVNELDDLLFRIK